MSSPSRRLLNKKFRKGSNVIAIKLKISERESFREDHEKLWGKKNPYITAKNLEQYIKPLNRGRVISLKEGLRHIVERNKDEAIVA